MSIKQNLVGQFQNPHGLLGQVAGFVMAHRPSNVERNQWTIELLEVKPHDRLLEIGYGPGLAIEEAAKSIKEGLIVGIDHSESMLRQATKRNCNAIRKGLVKLHLGTPENLPDYEKPFTKICSANVVQFWPDMQKTFRLLKAMLAPGGLIVTTYMPRHSSASNAVGQAKANEISDVLKSTGFNHIGIKELKMEPISAYSVLAINDEQ